MKIGIDYSAQYKNYTCGPASLKMIFDHLGIHYSREEMMEKCGVQPYPYGTETKDILDAIKQEGLVFREFNNGAIEDILRCLESGYPPLVNYYNPISKIGHYAVINGYHAVKNLLYFADPANGKDFTLSYAEFEALWHNSDHTQVGWMVVSGHEKIILKTRL